MGPYVWNAFIAVLGFAAIVAAAPALSYGFPDDCVAPSTATVYVTVPSASQEPSTVYVTVPISSVIIQLSEAPTTTLTRFETIYSTITVPISTAYISSGEKTVTEYLSDASTSSPANEIETPPYEHTITETSVITLTNVNLTPLPTGSSLTSTETPASNGLFHYVVVNDTTYWLDGQTPAPYESYVYSTSSITVYPVSPTASADPDTGILTIKSTIYYIQQLTLTETLETLTSSSSQAMTEASAGTISSYKGIGSGGWNMTSTVNADGVLTSAAANTVPVSTTKTSPITLVTDFSTFDLYNTRHYTISLSYLAAQSGFNAFSTPSADPLIATSASNQLYTSLPYSQSSSGVQYTNSTSITLSPSTGASAASGIVSLVNSSFAQNVQGPSSGLLNSSSLGTSSSALVVPLSSSGIPSQSSSSLFINSTSATSYTAAGLTTTLVSSLSSNTSLPLFGSSSTIASTTAASVTLSTSASGISSSSLPVSQSPSVVASSLLITFSTATTSTLEYSSSFSPSVNSSKTSTSASSSASATPSSCGEYGDFILNFDDIPPLSIGNQSINTVQPEPVFNPYHQFDFSDGFTVVPPPTDPYLPSSPPLLLEFIPNFNINGTNTHAGPNTAEGGYSGQISDGDVDVTGCFRFNVYGASFGCDSTGPDCDFTFSGYQLDASRTEVQIASQIISVDACPALANCTLTPVTLDNSFQNLAFVRINVTVAQQPKIWWMDDLRLGWYNNSCTTGLCRQTTHLH